MQALLLFGVVLAFINTQKPNFMNILLKIYFMNFDKTLAQSTVGILWATLMSTVSQHPVKQ